MSYEYKKINENHGEFGLRYLNSFCTLRTRNMIGELRTHVTEELLKLIETDNLVKEEIKAEATKQGLKIPF